MEGSSSSFNSSSDSSSAAEPAYSRGVRLRRFAETRIEQGGVNGFRLRVTAYGAYLMPAEIFRFRQDVIGSDTFVRFDGVCSPADLEDFPVGAPELNAIPPFLRTDTFDIVVRSQSFVEEVWELVQNEVATLVRTLDLMDDLTVTSDVVLGAPPPATPPVT